jgi:two-component system, NarL family, sensor kinase
MCLFKFNTILFSFLLLAVNYSRATLPDSILHSIEKSKTIQDKVKLVYKAGSKNYKDSIYLADCINKIGELAERHNNPSLKGYAYDLISSTYSQKDKTDSALKYCKLAFISAGDLNDTTLKALSAYNAGFASRLMSNYPEALKWLYIALENFQILKIKKSIAKTSREIGTVYRRTEDFVKAKEMLASSLTDFYALGDTDEVIVGENILGIVCAQTNQSNLALAHFKKAEVLCLKKGKQKELAQTYTNLCGWYGDQGNDSASYYNDQEIAIRAKLNDLPGLAIAFNNKANILYNQQQFTVAISYLDTALAYADTVKRSNTKLSILISYYKVYKALDKFEKALYYHEEYWALKDSIFNSQKSAQMAEMQTRFESHQKEAENERLTSENFKNSTKLKQQYYVIGLLIASLIILLLIYNRFLQRQKQRMELQTAQVQEAKTKAVLEAEEKERERIARDLHDGVGQVLSAARINLDNYHNTADPSALSTSLALIDEAVNEVRSVSHQMIPNTLLKAGFANAARDFLNKISSKNGLSVSFITHGLEINIPSAVETVLYRVLQESVSNIIKHANATKITIQVTADPHEVSMIVEDNGRGFDINIPSLSDGIGLKNIKSRVAYLNGEVLFDSSPSNGTTITVDIPLGK